MGATPSKPQGDGLEHGDNEYITAVDSPDDSDGDAVLVDIRHKRRKTEADDLSNTKQSAINDLQVTVTETAAVNKPRQASQKSKPAKQTPSLPNGEAALALALPIRPSPSTTTTTTTATSLVKSNNDSPPPPPPPPAKKASTTPPVTKLPPFRPDAEAALRLPAQMEAKKRAREQSEREYLPATRDDPKATFSTRLSKMLGQRERERERWSRPYRGPRYWEGQVPGGKGKEWKSESEKEIEMMEMIEKQAEMLEKMVKENKHSEEGPRR